MVDRIAEVLEDGTVYCFDMDKCANEAERILEELYHKEDTELELDYTATVYSLFINAVHILSISGWSTEELIEEVLTHSNADNISDDYLIKIQLYDKYYTV